MKARLSGVTRKAVCMEKLLKVTEYWDDLDKGLKVKLGLKKGLALV